MNYIEAAKTIIKHNHDIVWALENIAVPKRSTFIGDVLSLTQLSAEELESSGLDISNLNRECIKGKLVEQLPHIVWMIYESGAAHYCLSDLAQTLAQHGIIADPFSDDITAESCSFDIALALAEERMS